MSTDCALTTFDNPFDPFEQFISWFLFDIEKGYNCCGKIARIAQISDDFSQKEIDEEKERAIDAIVFNDPFNVYKKVTKNVATESN